MTGAQLAFYFLPIFGSISLFEVDIGSVPGRKKNENLTAHQRIF